MDSTIVEAILKKWLIGIDEMPAPAPAAGRRQAYRLLWPVFAGRAARGPPCPGRKGTAAGLASSEGVRLAVRGRSDRARATMARRWPWRTIQSAGRRRARSLATNQAAPPRPDGQATPPRAISETETVARIKPASRVRPRRSPSSRTASPTVTAGNSEVTTAAIASIPARFASM
jgi:hypothetical protein